MKRLSELWKTRNGKIAIIAGTVLLVCLCCVVVLTASPTTPTAPANPTAALETALAAAQGEVAQTQTAAAPTATFTPLPATNTPVSTDTPAPTIAPEVLTQEAQVATATELARYVAIDPRELLTYPKDHIGETIIITGRIFNINSNQELQVYVGDGLDAVYVVMRDTFNGIYEDDIIKIYGVIAGENCGTNAFGGEVCQPLLIDAFFEKQ